MFEAWCSNSARNEHMQTTAGNSGRLLRSVLGSMGGETAEPLYVNMSNIRRREWRQVTSEIQNDLCGKLYFNDLEYRISRSKRSRRCVQCAI